MDLSKAYDCLPNDLIIAKLDDMGLTQAVKDFYFITRAAQNNVLKWDKPLLIGLKFSVGFLKDQNYFHYYLIYS